MTIENLDEADRKILSTLQSDSKVSNSEIAERTGMSTSPCWRRTRRLEDDGFIKGYKATIDRHTLGLDVLVFVMVQIDTHSEAEAAAFEKAVTSFPQIVSCFSVGGGVDFMLQVVCKNLDEYAEFSMTQIRRLPGIKAMNSNFVLKEIKPFEGWPISES